MRAANIIPAILLMAALGTGGVVYAEVGTDSPAAQKGHEQGKWQHHNPLADLLPDDKRKILHDTMEKTRSDNKALWEQAHKLHEERDALLKAPTFDQDAYLKKSAELDALHEKMKQNHERAIASVAAQFSTEERRVLLVMGHMHHHHHGHGQGEWGHHDKKPGGEGDSSDQPS